jgi:RNA polymerase sigma-70 factor (ECF subfamily)
MKGEIIRQKKFNSIDKNKTIDINSFDHFYNESSIADDQLRMMYACCDPLLNEESQAAIVLKTLCGFSIAEIARAFLTNNETITKRLYRTKELFRSGEIKIESFNENNIYKRTDSVLNCIYLLFNEGYNATESEEVIREDLIFEAITLSHLLIKKKETQLPQVFALLALMYFHTSRNRSRLSCEGEIILFAEQDRKLWNYGMIDEGIKYLGKSATGNQLSKYHLEAGIAFEYVQAKHYADTNWKNILNYYDLLRKNFNSPIVELNRLVVVLKAIGSNYALSELKRISAIDQLKHLYIYHCIAGEIYFENGLLINANDSFHKALQLKMSVNEQQIIKKKMASIGLI